MTTFEDDLTKTIKQRILHEAAKAEYLKVDYQHRHVIPKDFIEKIWKSVNWDDVIEQIRPEIQTRICNAIVGNMETEIKTDVKSILSIDGVRQKLRVEVYPKIIAILDQNNISST